MLLAMKDQEETSLRRDMVGLLNRHSLENGSDTPDFILAKYMVTCLEAFDHAVREREEHYGRKGSKVSCSEGVSCG